VAVGRGRSYRSCKMLRWQPLPRMLCLTTSSMPMNPLIECAARSLSDGADQPQRIGEACTYHAECLFLRLRRDRHSSPFRRAESGCLSGRDGLAREQVPHQQRRTTFHDCRCNATASGFARGTTTATKSYKLTLFVFQRMSLIFVGICLARTICY
jgi:hypothetical protein